MKKCYDRFAFSKPPDPDYIPYVDWLYIKMHKEWVWKINAWELPQG